MTSELRTKNGESSLPRISRARARGPAECQRYIRGGLRTSAQRLSLNAEMDVDAEFLLGLLEDRNHNLGTIIDSQNDIGDAGLFESELTSL